MRVLLAGEESAGLQTFRLLSARNCLAAVCTSAPESTQQAGLAHALYQAAHRTGVVLRAATDLRNPALADWLRAQAVDLLLNVHSLYIIPDAILQAPRIGSFNLHPGLLPEYAGLHSASWAIYSGATEHGVTLHWMTAGIDAGAIAYQRRLPITDADTALSLNTACVRHGLELVTELLDTVAAGETIPALPQDRTRRRYFGRQRPGNGRLQWHQPAAAICRQIRASDYGPFVSPIGYPECQRANGRTLSVSRAALTPTPARVAPGTVAHFEGNDALVATQDLLIRVQMLRVTADNGLDSFVPPAKVLHLGEILRDGSGC